MPGTYSTIKLMIAKNIKKLCLSSGSAWHAGFTIFMVLGFAGLSAQSNFVPGYIVTIQDDTIYGEIDYRNWEFSPPYVRFSSGETSSVSLFQPGEIKGFYAQGEHYFSAVITHELSPYRISRLTDNPGLKLQTDTAFLLVLVSGQKNLYQYRSPASRDNFYIGLKENPELLIYKRFKVSRDNKILAISNELYFSQLEGYLDCHSNSLTPGYNERDLVKAYRQYYHCAGSSPHYVKAADVYRPDLGIFAGFSFTQTTATSILANEYRKFADVSFEPSNNFVAGIFADFPLRRRLGNWAITTELYYRKYLSEGSGFRQHNDFTSTHYQFELGGHQMGFYTGVRYRYNLRSGRLYAHAGMSNNFMLKEINIEHREINSLTGFLQETGPALENFRRHEQGMVIGLGYRLNILAVEIRREWGNGFSSYNSLWFTNRRLTLQGRVFIL